MENLLWASAIGSTLAWAAFDAIRKGLVGRIAVLPLAFWVSAAQIPGYLLWLALEGAQFPLSGYWAPALASIALNLISNLLFLEAMRTSQLSVAIPILSFTPVFVALSGIPLLGETLTGPQWAGVLLVTLGALFLTAPEGESLAPRRLVGAFVSSRAVHLMLGVSVLWALTPICDKLALRSSSVGFHGLALSCGVAVGMFGLLARRRGVATLAVSPKLFAALLGGGVVNVVALGLQLVTIALMVVSVFEAFKRAAGLILAMALGAFFFGESVTKAKLISAATMAVGVVLVLTQGT